jgi:hypothetical protein
MHYKNGREAMNGDKIVLLSSYHNPVVGVLYDAKPMGGNDCNGRIASLNDADPAADLKSCLHVDDILAVVTVPDTSNSASR